MLHVDLSVKSIITLPHYDNSSVTSIVRISTFYCWILLCLVQIITHYTCVQLVPQASFFLQVWEINILTTYF